jgi:dihydroorotate dehydrogenase (fumarate)
MRDLSTSYLGLNLRNPLVASASPLSKKLDTVRKLDEAGIGAIVMYSLFEEQIAHEALELDHYLSVGTDSFPEAITQMPDLGIYNTGPGKYLDHLSAVKRAVSVPVIASLNGVSAGGCPAGVVPAGLRTGGTKPPGWTRYAGFMEDAGADALELNLYYLATDPNLSGAELEDRYVELVQQVRSAVAIPLAVKLSPFVTALPNLAVRLVNAGANGLVLFNRFYQPDFDLEELDIVPALKLSDSDELRLPLRWISILYGRVSADFALTTGVHDHLDVLKALMAGARVTMLASELLKNGVQRVPVLLSDLAAWMDDHEYASVRQMQGSMSQLSVSEPAAFERANYMRVLSSWRELL